MGSKEKVATCLQARDWSARKVALKARVPETTFRGWLNGPIDNIPFPTIAKLAQVLGISLDWLAADELADDVIPEWAWRSTSPPASPKVLEPIGPAIEITELVERQQREEKRTKSKPKSRSKTEPAEPDPKKGKSPTASRQR